MKEITEGLKNFPGREEDTFERLRVIVKNGTDNFANLKENEKMRLEQELSMVKETGISCVILFFYDIKEKLKGVDTVFHGAMHCSYLYYILGLTRVNPFDYNLPFERYFGENKKNLPLGFLVVQRGAKGKVIKYLKQRYGVDKIARLKDWKDEYVISNKSLTEKGEIVETILHTRPGKMVWHEDVSSLTKEETETLGLYTFTLQEAKIQEYGRFTEEEIYQKTLERFGAHNFDDDEGYFGIKAAEHIFAETDGKFVYQEQFYTLCNRLLDVDNTTADLWRKSICKRRKSECEPIRERFENTLGKAGAQLFDYLYNRMLYAVCKAYVIGLLFLKM